MGDPAKKDCATQAPAPTPMPPDPMVPPGHRHDGPSCPVCHRAMPPLREVHADPYLPSYDSRKLYELSARGPDDFLQGVSSDPFSSSPPQYTGLRVPSLVPAGAPGASGRFLFLTATRVLSRSTRLRGIGQFLSIGCTFSMGAGAGTQLVPSELEVTTPTFKFGDGNVSWHLVYEQYVAPVLPATNNIGFAFRGSNSPALLYETFTTGFPGAGAGPVSYVTDLTAYTPPTIWAGWKPLAADLFNFSDLRFPMRSSDRWTSLDLPIRVQHGQRRVSLYCSILQSGGTFQNLLKGQGLTVFPGFSPEEQYIATVSQTTQSPTVGYFRVNGSLIFEDE